MRRVRSQRAKKVPATTPYDDEDLGAISRTLNEKSSAFPGQITYLRVLREFVAAARAGRPKSREDAARVRALFQFAATGFDIFLKDTDRSLGHAFRVRRSRGAPALPEKANLRFQLAYMVATAMDRGASLKKASGDVARLLKKKPSYVKAAYVKHASTFRPNRKGR